MNYFNIINVFVISSVFVACDGATTATQTGLDGVFPSAGEPAILTRRSEGSDPMPRSYAVNQSVSREFKFTNRFSLVTGSDASSGQVTRNIAAAGLRTAAPDPAGGDAMRLGCVLTAMKFTVEGVEAAGGDSQAAVDGAANALPESMNWDRFVNLRGADVSRPQASATSAEVALSLRDVSILGSVPWPDEPIGVGGTWETRSTIDIVGIPFQVVHSYKLLRIDKNKGSVAITMQGVGQATKLASEFAFIGADNGVLLSGRAEGDGTIYFDLAHPEACTTTFRSSCDLQCKLNGIDVAITVRQDLKATPSEPDRK